MDEGRIAVDPVKYELLEARMSGNFKQTVSPQPIPMDEVSASSMNSCHDSDRSDKGECQELREVKTPTNKSSGKHSKRRKLENSETKRERESSRKINDYFKNQQGQNNFISPLQTSPGSVGSYHLNSVPRRTEYCSRCYNSMSDKQERETQTDITGNLLKEQQLRMSSNLEEQNSRITELNQENDIHLKTIETLQMEIKKLQDYHSKCIEVIKKLLIEKAENERKECRRVSLDKRLRLGQFHAVRQGASFVDQWQDGYAFKELTARQNNIIKERDEMEKQKKNLQKRKPSAEGQKVESSKSKSTSLQTLSLSEFYEQDEILKIRALHLKKEEQDLSLELEKLERERNVHIRELKRLQAEDESSLRENTILAERYLLLHLLGKGGFSEVFKGFDLQEQRYVACKIHHVNKQWREDKRNYYIIHACREYEIHKHLTHPRIVRLYDVFEIDPHSFCTVLEYCEGNDLDFYLKQVKSIAEREAKSIIIQIVSALKYLNQLKPPVIHYDLKPGNILLGSGPGCTDIKITDFGLSKIMDDEHYSETQGGMELTSQGAGTYWYLPPEVFEDPSKGPPMISSKVDVWSVGVLFYQLIYGKKPYGHNESQAAILKNDTIRNAGPVDFPPKPVVSAEAKNFMRRCLCLKVSDRPDVLQLANSEYLHPHFSRKSSKNDFVMPSNSSHSTANNVNTITHSTTNSTLSGSGGVVFMSNQPQLSSNHMED